MDRTPAWVGIYRFVVRGRSLAEVFRFIEGHRGYRPKATVTLLYNRVLPRLAPERYANDPTAALLHRCAEGTTDPYFDQVRAELGGREPGEPPGVFPLDGHGLRGPTELDTTTMIATVPTDPPRSGTSRLGTHTMTPRTSLSAASERTTTPAISTLMQMALANPALVSLAAGFVDQSTLPVAATGREVAALSADSTEGRRALQYGTTSGDLGLRTRLVELLEENEGVPRGAYQEHLVPRTVVTSGSQQLLYLVAEALLDPGDIVLVESPTYFVFLGVLESRGARVIGVETDEGGLKLDALEETFARLDAEGSLERVKLIYTVSEHSNPSGISLAADRRGPLVALARRWSAKGQRIYVLEDAAYRGLTCTGAEPSSVWRHDPEGDTVILARTFSKTFSPGLKTGYGVLPASLVAPVLRLKGNHDFGSANFNQVLIDRLIVDGSYGRQVGVLVGTYRRKRDVMMEAMGEHLGGIEGVSWTRPRGGLFTWLTVPEGLDTGPDGPLFARCLEAGVIYVPGALAFADSPVTAPRNHARICFGVPGEADLVEGARRLAAALADCLDPVA